jgi:iron complex outermembrane receptor protein
MRTHWLFVYLLLLLAPSALAQATDDDLRDPESFDDTVTVTATRSEIPWGQSGRAVEVLTGDEVRAHGVRSVPALLQLVPGLDVRRRGVHGVQADLSIRGTSFNEVLVLVDGVPMSNPQSGHHNMDLPVPASAIERVEVLYGPGSALYGANAAGGVVQIFTRAGGSSKGVEGTVSARAGENSLADGGVDLGWTGDRASHRVSVERAESQGYQPGLEFDVASGLYRGAVTLGSGSLDLLASASEREFGAQNFYSTRFPNQWEATEARLGAAAWNGVIGDGGDTRVTFRAALREHQDLFILERSNPGLLTNVHADESRNLELSLVRDTAVGTLAVGAGWTAEDLDSTNLGLRERERWGTFLSLVGSAASAASAASANGNDRWGYRLALAADRVEGGAERESTDDWEIHPSLAVTLGLGSGHLRASAASSYRVPTFTELYYRDPASAGSPDLTPEHSWTYELGYDWSSPRSRASATVFERDGQDLIDFVQAPGETLFVATNLRDVTTRGVELVTGRRFRADSPSPVRLTASYTWLDSSGSEPPGVSRYVFDYLQHRALVRADGTWGTAPVVFRDLRWAATGSYSARNGADSWVRLDARVGKTFQWGVPVELFVEDTNLTDERYVEQGVVEMPGRWVVVGVGIEVD